MSTDGQERAAVRTYVPADQKAAWREDADRMEMTLSEFVRTMVQAGRADFPVPSVGSGGDDGGREDGKPRSSAPADATPGGRGLEDRIIGVLRDGPLDPDELVAAVTEEVEDQVYDALDDLAESNRVRFDPREGGYTLSDDVE